MYKNISLLAAGAVIGKIVGIVSIPIVTRLYEPDDFGILSMFLAVVSILTPVATLRYVDVIPLPRTQAAAACVACVSIIFVVIFCTLLSASLFAVGDKIFVIFGAVDPSSYIALVPLAVFLGAFVEILSLWAIRNRDYKRLAIASATGSIIGSGVKIILGFLDFRFFGLLIGQIVSQCGGLLSIGRLFLRDFIKHLKLSTSKRIIFFIKYYWAVPAYRFPATLIFAISAHIPILFFSKFYGFTTAGHLGLAFSMVSLPVILLARSTGNVYYGEVSKLGRENTGEILFLTKDLVKKLAGISIIPAMAIFILSPYVFGFAFGAQWEQAGRYASTLSIFMVAQFISNPIMRVLNVLRKEAVALRIHVTRLVLVILVFLGALKFDLSPGAVLMVYSIVLAFHYTITTYRILRTLKKLSLRSKVFP